MMATKLQIELPLAELKTEPAILAKLTGHKACLQLPILGNPNGRIFQAIQLGQDIPTVLLAILQRYGDLLPRTAIAEYHDTYGRRYILHYTQVSSGSWVIADMEEALPVMPVLPPGPNDPTL